MTIDSTPRLTIELVPRTCWFSNVRDRVSREDLDRIRGVQSLTGMIALCPACHEVKHMGLAGIKGRGEIAAAHLAEVNGWNPQVTAAYIDQAFAVWKDRSNRTWSLDVSALSAYGIDPAIIADANGTSAEDRSSRAAVATAEVRSCEVRLIPQSELDSYIDHLMYEL